MMNPKLKTRLLKDLRSGAYVQTTGRLNRVDLHGGESFCCLGVICDIHARTTRGQNRGWEESDYTRSLEYLKGIFDLPDSVRKWAGLSDVDCSRLINMNDGEGGETPNSSPKTFRQIADHIEKNL